MYFIIVILFALETNVQVLEGLVLWESSYWGFAVYIFSSTSMLHMSLCSFHARHSFFVAFVLDVFWETEVFWKDMKEVGLKTVYTLLHPSPCCLRIAEREESTSKHIWLLLQNQKIDCLFSLNRLKNMLFFEYLPNSVYYEWIRTAEYCYQFSWFFCCFYELE